MLFLVLLAQVLTLQQAWDLAFQGARWKALQQELSLREAEGMEGVFWANPQISYEAEEVRRGSFQEGLQTFRFSWEVPLSPTARYARKAWSFTREQNTLLAEAMKTSFRAEVARRFVQALAARKRRSLEQNRLKILDTLLAYTQRRLRAGRSHPAEVARLEAQRSRQMLVVQEAHVEVVQADLALQSFFAKPFTFDSLAIKVFLPTPSESLYASLQKALEQAPRARVLALEIRRQEALKKKAQWAFFPNPEIGGGPQRSPEGTAVTVEIGLSLPLFNRNQAERALREARFRQARFLHEVEVTTLRQQLAGAWEQYRHAWEHHKRLQEEILPALEEAYQAYETGYLRGRFDLTTLLDAQKELLEARLQALEVEIRAWEAWLLIYETLGQKEVWP